MAENSILFVSYSQIQTAFKRISGINDEEALSLPWLCAAGGASGAIVSFVLTPIELVKCQLQINGGRFTGGPFGLLKDTLKKKGISGIYRGHVGTVLREISGGVAWFGSYELILKLLMERNNLQSKRELSPLQLIGAGAIAGMSYNICN